MPGWKVYISRDVVFCGTGGILTQSSSHTHKVNLISLYLSELLHGLLQRLSQKKDALSCSPMFRAQVPNVPYESCELECLEEPKQTLW